MKKILTQLKKRAGNLFAKILRHESAVYTAIIMLVMCIMFFYTNEIKHGSEILKTEKEKAILILELNQSKFMHNQTGQAFDFQMGVIKKQSKQLHDADRLIEMQHSTLQKLIQYLKNLGEWPPNLEPIDPNKITEGKSNVIRYDRGIERRAAHEPCSGEISCGKRW